MARPRSTVLLAMCTLLAGGSFASAQRPRRTTTAARTPTTSTLLSTEPTTPETTLAPESDPTTASGQEPTPTAALRPNGTQPGARSITPAINPIVVKGMYLYDAVTQKRFFAKGVDYNPMPVSYAGSSFECRGGKPKFGPFDWGTDLVTDELEELWSEDLDAIAELGANTVRIYEVDPEKSHKKFMEKAASLGLYIIVPLTRHSWGYLPAGFPSPDCYSSEIEGYGNVGVNLLTSAKLIVKQFSEYSNTLLFTVGNEVETSGANGYAALPCVKALTRDIHKFQDECASGMRRVPLMYAATDVGGETRRLVAEYVSCELDSSDDADDAVDVYGINVYSWCDSRYVNKQGRDDFTYSPYYELHRDLSSFKLPVVFAEFGCTIGEFKNDCPYKGGRTWPDVPVIINRMGDVISGALAYAFTMEGSRPDNQFGLVLKPGFLEGQDAMVKLDTYYALQKTYLANDISARWDARWDDATRCSWDPVTGPFARTRPRSSVSVQRSQPSCPSQAALRRLFRNQVRVTRSLPSKPNVQDLECPNYLMQREVVQENMCSKASGTPRGNGTALAAFAP